jgi:ATP-dependent protease ClpP protease subunit
MTDTITITVDADTAKKYREATDKEREAYDLMLSLRLRMLTHPPTRTLKEVMADMRRYAAENGMTEEVLNDILREDKDERRR